MEVPELRCAKLLQYLETSVLKQKISFEIHIPVSFKQNHKEEAVIWKIRDRAFLCA